MKTTFLRIALAGALLAPALASAACEHTRPTRLNDYEGELGGKYKIRLTLMFDGEDVTGEYFYLSQLKDIPLRGSLGAKNSISLNELDASGAVAATFSGVLEDECGTIKGHWQKAGAPGKLPFSLKSTGSHSGRLEHRYGIAGNGTDEIVHANAYKFWLGVKNGDKTKVASMIDYPIEVHIAGKPRRVRNAKEFIAAYDGIFTPAFRQVVIDTVPHNMSADSNGIMLDHGAVWLDDMGKVKTFNN